MNPIEDAVKLLLDAPEPKTREELGLSVHYVRKALKYDILVETGKRVRVDENGLGIKGRPLKLYSLAPRKPESARVVDTNETGDSSAAV
jgi:hypothetical protein